MKEIAEKMLRSFDTVKFYRRQIFEKLDVQNITEALALAINYGLVSAVIPTLLTCFTTQMGNFHLRDAELPIWVVGLLKTIATFTSKSSSNE